MRSKLPVTLELRTDLPPLSSDRQKVKQILLNLLSNALKFTHQGGVTIAARRNTERPHDPAVGHRHRHRHRAGQIRSGSSRTSVSSTTRRRAPTAAPASARRSAGGSRRCSTAGFRCRARLGKGSTFTLTLPTQRTEMSKKPARPRVLLVDDYPDAREMYSEYLQFSGFDVVEAANGMEALQSAIDRSRRTSSSWICRCR